MKQSTITVEDALAITCEAGSVRSLALRSGKLFEKLKIGNDPKLESWDFAKAVKENYGAKFTEENAREHFRKVYVKTGKTAEVKKPLAKKPNTSVEKKADAVNFDKKAQAIIDNPAIPKNEKIRKLLPDYKVSQIAKALELSFQRVKNIEKKLLRDAEGVSSKG